MGTPRDTSTDAESGSREGESRGRRPEARGAEARGSEASREKKELRTELRRRLAGLTEDQRRAAEQRIARRVLDLPEIQRAQGVLSCLSFGSEVDTWSLVEGLMEAGKALYVPRADAGDPRLHIHLWPCRLTTLEMGLRQPPAGEPEVPFEAIDDQIDVAIVLGLGFERRRGFRLGYGGGYFDRFLGEHPKLLSVALAFECQLADRLPVEPHDVPMGRVVTEERVLRFEAEAEERPRA